jgi:FKBP-type peptidyl-prolyl cis-trans isomerase FkpA
MSFRIVWFNVVLLVGAVMATGCGSSPTSPSSSSSGVTFSRVDLTVGNGDTVAKGDRIKVWYTGWIYVKSAPGNKGESFDSNRDRELFRYIVGTGHVIEGWDQGVPGMKVGGIRRLIIPPELAYGSQGQGPIPPGASLIFEIEVVEVEKPPFY